MKWILPVIAITYGVLVYASPAGAVVCAKGVYRAGCAGPNGAVVTRPPYVPPRPPVVCGAGPYRAGCAGPHGAVVRRRYY